MAKTRIVRYTEDEFVSLLENIVKRVKKEEINESRTRRTKPSTKRPTRRR
jgi:hypothetical protein